MVYRFVAVVVILVCFLQSVFTQTYQVRGKVIDKDTREALAFVNILNESGDKSTTSSIDGLFYLQSALPILKISFSYVGYYPLELELSPEGTDSVILVKLVRKDTELAEILVVPGKNPAHRIIDKVVENRNKNNPEKSVSFSYSSYNKMYFTLHEDTTLRKRAIVDIDSMLKDSTNSRINNIIKKHHLFLMEFVSNRYYQSPDKDHEEIVSSRVSGFTDPAFTFLGTQMQSFGFYDEMVSMLDKKYLNPISKGSYRKYFFLLEDTFITETYDTLFVITFTPRRGKNFEGLKGVLYINSNGYAIQNVIAEPAQGTEKFVIRIQQKYDLVDGKQWFPSQLNVDLLFKNMKIHTRTRELYPVGVGKSYINNVKLNPDLSGVKFNQIAVDVTEDASRRPDSVWYNYRPLPLNKLDSATYRVIDSIGRARQFDKKIKFLDAMATGNLPFWVFNIDYRKFISYNRYEGLRAGMGLMTNEKVASFFSVGGYFAYGFHDKQWKYSPTFQLFPKWESETRLTLRYTHDVWETGQYSFFEDRLMTSSEWFRDFLVNQMDMIDEKEISLSFRILKYLKINLYMNQSIKHINDYDFLTNQNGNLVQTNDFHFTEAGVSFKFAFREKFIQTPAKKKLSLGTKYPMVWINIKKGLNFWDGDYEYTKYELKVSGQLITRKFGQSKATLVTGKVFGNIPISNLYNGRGSYQSFTLEAENSFGTMRFNEFQSSEFISLFFKQNFGSLLLSFPKFRPEFCLVTNLGYGRLRNSSAHNISNKNVPDRGYYESGILVNKIITQPFISMGLGVMYRYGHYSFIRIADNFAYKLTLNLNL